MFKKLNKKGFTLAELLVVVAIIGVLVAISIPIFTSQLEKAREATDEANLRSLYAEASVACLTETAKGDNKGVENKTKVSWDVDAAGVVTATATYQMTQQVAGYAGDTNKVVNIGGVDLNNAAFNTGIATITVKGDGTKPTIDIAKGK